MSRLLRAAAALAIGVAAFAPPVPAQQVPLRDLPKPAREIEDPFSLIIGAMELKPGQVILYDGVDGELVIVDFANGSRTPIGRQGSGPGEYKSIAGLFRQPGDTIWALDAAQMRVVVFTPDLKPGTTFPLMMFDAQAGTALTAPFQSDGRGRIYSSAMKIQTGGGRGAMSMQFPDSVGVVRFDARNASERTEVARVRFPMSGNPQMQQSGNSFKYSMAYPGLVAADAWAVFNDGRMAIVRGASYTVELVGADGRTTGSVRIPYDRIPVTDADRKAEMDEAKRQMEEQGKAAQKMMPAGISMEFELLPPASWPDAYPPVSPLGALAAPNGDLWVRRAIPIRVGRDQWDVLDRSGKLVARWRLPAKTTIVAIGQGVVYTVRTDEDDLRYVQRVEVPR